MQLRLCLLSGFRLVGLGDRGSGAVERLSFIEGVEINALCDLRPSAVADSQKYLKSIGRPAAKEFSEMKMPGKS